MTGRRNRGRRDRSSTGPRPRSAGPPRQMPASAGPGSGPGIADDALPELDLITDIDRALRQPHPLDLLLMASGIVTTLDPRSKPVFPPVPDADAESHVSLAELCESFMDVGFTQTDALLKVLGELAGDDLLRERIRRSVLERRHPIPGWVRRLDQVQPFRAVWTGHVLRDGENILVGVHLPGNRELTLLVYVDHNMGTLVKDAFVVDSPLDDVLERFRAAHEADEELVGTETRELSLADARARIGDAIANGLTTFPPFETDTWPSCRALIEWIARLMPDGGEGYERPEWSDRQRKDLLTAFFRSSIGKPLDDDDHRALFESIVWFNADYNTGDPMRWSPVNVEILLADWLPRTVMADAEYLGSAPDLLRAFIEYCHAERNIPSELTTQTLAAVDRWEPAFREAIAGGGAKETAAMLAQAGFDWDDVPARLLDTPEPGSADYLRSCVGGAEALAALTAEPLPDEAFDWAGLPEDILAPVADVVALVDRCAEALFDTEFRTAARRLLARVAAADSNIFRRRSAAKNTAAAICWVIAKANDSFSLYYGPKPQVKDLNAHLGVASVPTQRATTMLKAIGIDWWSGDVMLGTPDLLTSTRREGLMADSSRLL